MRVFGCPVNRIVSVYMARKFECGFIRPDYLVQNLVILVSDYVLKCFTKLDSPVWSSSRIPCNSLGRYGFIFSSLIILIIEALDMPSSTEALRVDFFGLSVNASATVNLLSTVLTSLGLPDLEAFFTVPDSSNFSFNFLIA